MIKLSIIVPMYNEGKYIVRCLDSIVGQDMPRDEYEIIVVDDGSTDSSYEIVCRYIENYDNISVYRQANSGLSVARNLGLENARGRYIYFVDGDDALIPDSLSKIYRLLFNSRHGLCEVSESAPEVIAFKYAYSNSDQMNSYSVEENSSKPLSYLTLSGIDFIAKCGYYNAVWLYIVDRKLIDKLGVRFEPGKCSEDAPFTTEILLAAKSLIYVDLKVYFYSYNAQSITRSKELSKVLRFMDGNIFASNALNELMEKYSDIPSECRRVIVDRRDRMLLEALESIAQRVDFSMIGAIVNDLKAKKLYPISGITKYSDGSTVASAVYRLYNSRFGISLLNRVHWTRRKIKSLTTWKAR